MENLDNQIDTMFKETIYLIEAQNAARVKKFTIRYTKSNQLNSPEHLEALLGSHEKAIREIPRQFLRIEKSARLKYLAPLGEKRQCGLLKVMTDHVEMLVEKMNRKYRDIFKDQQRVEEFDERMKKTLITAKQKMSEETSKVTESLNGELNSSPKIKPSELAKFYELDESALIDLKAIEPLQIIHEVFRDMQGDQNAKIAFEGIRQSILICSKFGTQVQIDPSQNHTEAARRFKKRSLVAGTLVLKDLIDAIYILTQQLDLPIENRNNDIISKTYNRLKESLKEHDGAEKVMANLSTFFQMLSIS